MRRSKSDAFFDIAASLRVYRRAELRDYALNNDDMLESVYVDPLEGGTVLKTVLAPNSTIVYGRKGTGKSTIFAKAQRDIRDEGKNISIYLDVKTLHSQVSQMATVSSSLQGNDVDESALRSHLFRKQFLALVLRELAGEFNKALNVLGVIEKIFNKGPKYRAAIDRLKEIESDLSGNNFTETELPILQTISKNSKNQQSAKTVNNSSVKGSAGLANPTTKIEGEYSILDEALQDDSIAQQYASVLLRSFPFSDILKQIDQVLEGADLNRLYVFLDDFSEITLLDQRLFVDVILTQLNNSSNERIKLKIAVYPGRAYFGGMDPSKIDHIMLDFYDLYKSDKLPEIEDAAIGYTRRLLKARFNYYGYEPEEFMVKTEDPAAIYQAFFEASFNIPRVLGYLLHYLHLDISKGQQITRRAIRTAALKYFEQILEPYFQANSDALEPYAAKLDRFNQKRLLELMIGRSRAVKKGIVTGKYKSSLFVGLSNPPTSHFTIASGLESVLASLEFNQFLSKYHKMRDKDGHEVSVFAINVGVCEQEEIEWGYPKQTRYHKDYFKQRVFSFNALRSSFLRSTQAIICSSCGKSYPIEQKQSISDFGWLCRQCNEKTCEVRYLDGKYKSELEAINTNLSLDVIELDILQVLHEEKRPLRAKEISALLDATYQLVGKRTEKLKDLTFVDKKPDDEDVNRSTITAEGESTYFSDDAWRIHSRENDDDQDLERNEGEI